MRNLGHAVRLLVKPRAISQRNSLIRWPHCATN